MSDTEFGFSSRNEKLEVQPPSNIVLRRILRRYNGIATASRGANFYYAVEGVDDTPLNVVTPRQGNDLAISAGKKSVFIGYVHPTSNEFTHFPEVVSATDFMHLNEFADCQRRAAIERFDTYAEPGTFRTDYSDPRIRELHQVHAEFLKESGLAERVACELNKLHGSDDYQMETFAQYVEIDEATHFYLTLADKPELSKDSPAISDFFVVLNFMHHFTEINGVKVRKKSKAVNIAKRVVNENGECEGFEFESIDDLVPIWHIDDVNKLVTDTLAAGLLLALEGLNFSPSNMVILTPPNRTDTEQSLAA